MLTFVLFTTLFLTEPWSIASLRMNHSNASTRRDVCQRWLTAANVLATATTTTSFTVTTLPLAALARNLPQDTGADRSATGTLSTLIPIVKIQKTLSHVNNILSKPPRRGDVDAPSTFLQLQEIKTAIANIPTLEQKFKRVFDEYSDPVSYKQKYLDQNAFLVYYTKGFDGPNRPSIEADLSDLKQTLQYGARNEAWVAWEGFVSELQFAPKQQQQQQYPVSATGDNNDNTSSTSFHELLSALQATQVVVDSYLSLAPPTDLVKAQQQIQ